MFGNDSTPKKPSLLMRAKSGYSGAEARRNESNVVRMASEADMANAHRRARAARKPVKPNPLLAALGRKPEQNDFEDEALSAIERDVDALMAKSAIQRPQQRDVHQGIHSTHQGTASEKQVDAQEPLKQPMPPNQDSDVFKPLIDPVIMLNSLWRWRWPIAGLTIAGGAVGVLVALSTPSTYTAYTKVIMDPRAIKLVDRDLTPEYLGDASALAFIDSQLESVTSTPVLERVIKKLHLDKNAEFNGNVVSGTGLFDGIAFVRSLFSKELPDELSERTILENLKRAVSVQRSASTFVFEVAGRSTNPKVALNIANTVTQAFIDYQNELQSTDARNATTAIGGQLEVLKSAVENAERQAEDYAQENGLTRINGNTLSDTQLAATNAQLSDAKAATIRARALADSAKSANIDQVVGGGLPVALITPALTTFQAQFASLSQNAASLEQALGPRHPRLANAIAARDAARSEISAELNRIIAGTQADLRSAIQSEQEIAASLAQAKAQSGANGDALIRLRELESEIEAAQTLYKSALLRVGETAQLEKLALINATFSPSTEVPLYPSSVSRKVIAITGALSGMMLGLGLAFLFGMRDCLHSNNNAPKPSPNGGRQQRKKSTQSSNPFNANSPMPAGNPASPVTANSEKEMYPSAPFYPYAQDPQAQQQPQPAYQQSTYAQQPHAPYQPTQLPMGYAHQPVMQPHYAPYPQQQPMAYHPQPIMQQPYYQPMMPQHYPAPQPSFVQQQPHQNYAQPAPQQMPAQPAGPTQEELELQELRASVRDIRDVVDSLAQRRTTGRRFG